MNRPKIISIFDKVVPDSFKTSIDLVSIGRSYRQLRIILFATMICIATAPLLMVGGLSYYYYSDLLQNSEREQLEWKLGGKLRTIEQMVENLMSVVQFAARSDRYTELISGNSLEYLLTRLQHQYGFFADLGVVEQAGIQRAYFGPYDLVGADYSQEEWFNEVLDRGVYISRVYTGYRQIPHFAIAVSNLDPITRKVWVLRATIDAATLQNFINTIKTNESDDLFLIDDTGTLQTSSQYYGDTLSLYPSTIQAGIRYTPSETEEKTFTAIDRIKNTPWSLVIMKKKYIHQEEWQDFKLKLYTIIFSGVLVIFVVVYSLVNILTKLIRKTDEIQIAMLKEAEHTDKLASIGRLAAGVGHEINNPLAIINEKTGLIEDLLLISPEFEHKNVINDNLRGINKSVDRCKAITHRLLGFARRTVINAEPMQLNEVITEVLQFLDNAIVYNRIKVELQMQEDLPLVTTDHVQLQQIFLNIINNAIDAIRKDGVISITTHMVAGDIRVVIQDDGPGIDSESLPHIFEPFFTTKEAGKGTGLGLSITYGLIKKLGGDITVRSQLGIGTAFTITIPLHGRTNDRQRAATD